MKKVISFCAALALLTVLPACQGAKGDGPDVATSSAKVQKKKSKRQMDFLKAQLKRERISEKDINTPGGLEDFQVFPTRSGKGRRSESLNKDFSPFPWK